MRTAVLVKSPEEMFAVGLEYISPDLDEGEELVSCEVTITPDEAAGLKKQGNLVIEPTIASQMIYGGEVDREYYVHFKTTTSVNHIYQDSIFVKVRAL